MTISNTPFIEIEIDFMGKSNATDRQLYLEDCATILFTEYEKEITQGNGVVEFFYIMPSRMKFMPISEFEHLQFDVQIKAKKFMQKQKA